MKLILLFFLFVGCAHHKKDYVTLDAALNQAQSSYLKGCVTALTERKIHSVFEDCRDKAIKHREELNSMMVQTLEND